MCVFTTPLPPPCSVIIITANNTAPLEISYSERQFANDIFAAAVAFSGADAMDATQGEGCEFEPPEAEPFDVEGAVPLEVCVCV